jgi:hypothetical protein
MCLAAVISVGGAILAAVMFRGIAHSTAAA